MADVCLGAQLYTIRDFMKTEQDFAESMTKIADIGYKAVQLSGQCEMTAETMKRILDDNGLVCAATHVPYEKLRDETEAMIEHHKTLECDYPAIGGMGKSFERTAEGLTAFAKEASDMAAKLAEAGLTFSYHNHNWEFERFGDRTGFEILFTESDPKVFNAEPDVYWIQAGGGDPAYWVRWLKGRAPLIHLKDMGMKGREQTMAEIGVGNLNWPAILDACKEAGAVWYLVEQDTCPGDPFDSLAISYTNCTAMGLV